MESKSKVITNYFIVAPTVINYFIVAPTYEYDRSEGKSKGFDDYGTSKG